MSAPSNFWDDGHTNARTAVEAEIRSTVYAEYKNRLRKASLFGQLRLRIEMRREVERRIAKQAPPDGLY